MEQYCESLHLDYCNRLQACGFIKPEELPFCTCNTLRMCRERLLQVVNGAAEFVPQGANACLTGLASNACSDLRHLTCLGEEVFRQTGTYGSSCDNDTQCSSGFCRSLGKPLLPHGQCAPYAENSAFCFAPDRCDPRVHFCEMEISHGGKTCRVLRSRGEPCTLHEQCAEGFCNQGDVFASGRTCGYVPLGSPCYLFDCGPDATCAREPLANGGFPELGVCKPRIPTGQRCGPQPMDWGCAERMPCVDGVCIAPHSIPVGQDCYKYRAEDVTRQCVESAFCDVVSGRSPPLCTPRRDIGGPCSPERAGLECKAGLSCVPDPMALWTGTCEAGPRAEGQPCTHSGQCANQHCATPPGGGGAVCLRLPGIGEDCTTLGRCSPDAACWPTSEGVRTCLVKRFMGTACSHSPDCLSGICADLNRNSEFNTPGKFCWQRF